LIISPTPTHPTNGGNRRRIYALLEAIQALDHEFHFAFFPMEGGDRGAMEKRWGAQRVSVLPYTFKPRYAAFWRRVRNFTLRHLGIEEFHPSEVDVFASPELAKRVWEVFCQFRPSSVIVEYVFNSWLLEQFPATVRKLIDTHDVFADRYKLFHKAGVKPEWFSTTRRQERKGLRRADCVIAIQDREAEYFRRLTNRQVVTVGHITPVLPLPEPAGAGATVLFVGGDNPSNRDALEFCFQEVWPLIRAVLPEACLKVAGPVCCHFSGPPAGVDLLGEIADITAAYAQAQVVLNPLRFGTGLKIKSVEALSYGRPLVTTSVGAEGLGAGCEGAWMVGTDAKGLADHCVRLLRDAVERHTLAAQAVHYVADSNVRQYQALREALEVNPKPVLHSNSGAPAVPFDS
jgi:glycosyltransferase involved in cell wall biosynthesis